MAQRMGTSWVRGSRYTGGQPARPITPVDGLGAPAGVRPLALRLHDALGFQPQANPSANLLGLRYTVACLDRSQTVEQFNVDRKRKQGPNPRAHQTLSMY